MATTVPVGNGRLILGNNLSETIFGNGSNETVYGYAGRDSINGFEGNDYIDGGLGDDTLSGGSGNNTLIGGAGNDFLDGSLGTNDLIIGGTGFDSALYLSLAGFLTAVANGVENPLLVNLVATTGADNLVGTTGDDTIDGLAGDDTIRGLAGNDTLTGGTGADLFTFASSGDAFDTITDFNTADGDKIQLGTGFNKAGATNPLVTGTQLILNQNFFVGVFGDLTGLNATNGVANGPLFYLNTGDNNLSVDLDGQAAGFGFQKLAVFSNSAVLAVGDFVVI